MQLYINPDHHLHATDQIIQDGTRFITTEIPQRAAILADGLRNAGLGRILPAADHGIQPLLAIHTPEYLHFLQHIYAQLGAFRPVFPTTFAPRSFKRHSQHPEALPGYFCFGTGSPILEGTWQAAYGSAQAALSACDAVLSGQPSAYAVCRPPGHHASAELYGGFCYLNNAAIAVRYLQSHSKNSQTRVAVLDIDYHHGNGTQEIFYQDGTVLFCSLHADPDLEYPYFWGAADEIGAGSGAGANFNYPLQLGIADDEYLHTLDKALEHIARFSPQWLVLSAGMDIGAGDPEGRFAITSAGFERIGKQIASLHLPTVIIQEGGYRLDMLAEWATALLTPFA
jgi:acetoin utilization deacetylase AcuC-like enzyme